MAKKHKKFFKQKLRQMIEQQKIDQPDKGFKQTSSTPVKNRVPLLPEQKTKETSLKKTESSLISLSSIRSDLTKVAYLAFSLGVLIFIVFILSQKTGWISFLADKLYHWARLDA